MSNIAGVAALHQVHWQRPDVVWAIDGAEHNTEFADKKMYVQNLQDLCTRQDKVKTTREIVLLTETAAHDLNHKPQRRLNGQTTCRVYFGNNRMRFTKRKRRSAYEWIKNLAVDISEKAGHDSLSCLAWRVAAKKWLEKNDLIRIIKPGKVLPHFSASLCHN